MLNDIRYILNLKKRAFTLLEIIIVIIIIWILMAATMRFWGGRVSFLNNKNVKEQFVSSYDKLYSNNMMSSYYMWDIYNKMVINFEVGNTWFDFLYQDYDWNDLWIYSSFLDAGSYVIDKLQLWWQEINNLDLEFSPYVLGCSINWEENIDARLDIVVNHDKFYCFEIKTDSCRLNKINCD